MSANSIEERLLALSDRSYKEFNRKLLPTVDPGRIIGVRMPLLRKLSKNITWDTIGDLPYRYHEHNMLHALLINRISDVNECVQRLECFLPYVDNWAVCDSLRPHCVSENKQAFLHHVKRWIASDHPFTVRFAIEMLMIHYLDEDFLLDYPFLVASVQSDEYYINMMVAWYFATALAERYDDILPYLEEHRLRPWIHGKTIQKAIESFRIPDNRKIYLRTLRQK